MKRKGLGESRALFFSWGRGKFRFALEVDHSHGSARDNERTVCSRALAYSLSDGNGVESGPGESSCFPLELCSDG